MVIARAIGAVVFPHARRRSCQQAASARLHL